MLFIAFAFSYEIYKHARVVHNFVFVLRNSPFGEHAVCTQKDIVCPMPFPAEISKISKKQSEINVLKVIENMNSNAPFKMLESRALGCYRYTFVFGYTVVLSCIGTCTQRCLCQ